ncbi:MAG: hypothetical protein IKP61_10700 [Spirochaetales bacterium]|nr:hypothetical protein [Spirochaetales bacterium]
MKRPVIVIIFLIAVSFCLFADNNTSFRVSHSVSVETVYSLKFREYTSSLDVVGNEISSATIGADGKQVFASLFLNFNRSIQFKTINVTFSDLVSTTDASVCCPYTMEVLVPAQNNTHLVETYVDQNGHGSGNARLLPTITTFSRTTTDDSENLRIADFAITINDEEAQVGTYSGTLTFTFEVN